MRLVVRVPEAIMIGDGRALAVPGLSAAPIAGQAVRSLVWDGPAPGFGGGYAELADGSRVSLVWASVAALWTTWLGAVASADAGRASADAADATARQDARRGMPAVRAERNARLQASDWTVAADSPLTHANRLLWRAYRRTLRDVPESQPTATLDTVVWPAAPAAEAALGSWLTWRQLVAPLTPAERGLVMEYLRQDASPHAAELLEGFAAIWATGSIELDDPWLTAASTLLVSEGLISSTRMTAIRAAWSS